MQMKDLASSNAIADPDLGDIEDVSVIGESILNSRLDAASRLAGEKDGSGIRRIIQGLGKRKARWLPTRRQMKALDELSEKFPHFKEVIDFFRVYITLCAERGATRCNTVPILLKGKPGVGKTHLAKELARAIRVDFHSISMSMAAEGFYLTGLQRGFATSTPGQLAKVMAKSRHCNPIFLLDEFDKATWVGRDGRNGMEPAILQMFERDSAKAVDDLCLEVSLNLSEVSYIATANSVDPIPKPILSRLKVFEIPSPSPQMCQQIIESVLNAAVEEDLGMQGITVRTGPDVATLLDGDVTPRTIRNASASILGPKLMKVIDDDEIYITAEDIEPSMPRGLRDSREIGFHANI